ncbi:MAG: hypothetical protein P8M62_06860 [Opitutae bacterium]|nr:hypothetical protein [Opitutae bacterium]
MYKKQQRAPLTTAALIAAATLSLITGCEVSRVESVSATESAPTEADKDATTAPKAEPSKDTEATPVIEPTPDKSENAAITRSEPATVDPKFQGYETVVSDTHAASLAARKNARAKVAASDKCWPYEAWGDTMWALCALYENKKVELANQRLLERAQAYIDVHQTEAAESAFVPEKREELSPWAYFAITDYVRILDLFHAESPHFPGRLQTETEAAMKEALWWLVKSKSRVIDASLDNLLVLQGTENHDLTLRPNYYLIASLFKEDPAFKDRRYDDGHTAAEHFAAYNAFFQKWPVQRIKSGLWFEVGSDSYQKYSWPALFNLHDLSPDPLVRKRFGMLLDIAFIEEAQVSVNGRRGGGRSRAGYGKNNFEAMKNLLYAPEGEAAGSSHSKVIETSSYQLPAAAILLRTMAFPAYAPFVISNRVLGELEAGKATGDNGITHAADSAQINYAYRTPHYILGSTLQNPALSMPAPDTKEPILKYAGIVRQNRWSGILFDDPDARQVRVPASHHRADDELCAIFPEIDKTRGGRPQHGNWSFQHKDVLFIQRIDEQKGMGSYSTGRMSMRFHGKKLQKVEQDGWIFASNGKAYAAVKFLDGGYEWDESGELASPLSGSGIATTTRVLMQTGDMDSYTSFKAFQSAVLANPLRVQRDQVAYQSSRDGSQLVCFRYDAHEHKRFKLPTIDGQAIDLRPDWTFRSPCLNNSFGGDQVKVSIGPIQEVYDFGTTSL